MDVNILIPKHLYRPLRRHLFKGRKEQGAFLFVTDSSSSFEMNLIVEDIYLIPPEAWEFQESGYLQLSDEEKVRIMLMARDRNCNLVECHSHRNTHGTARFSPSDTHGLEEFIGYVRWKLPGKKYGALVWTKSSVCGQVWDGKNPSPMPVKDVRVVRKDGTYRAIRPSHRFQDKILRWMFNIPRRDGK